MDYLFIQILEDVYSFIEWEICDIENKDGVIASFKFKDHDIFYTMDRFMIIEKTKDLIFN